MKVVFRVALTFEEHIAIVATESSPAAVLDWWRRLDLIARKHFSLVHGRTARDARELMKHIATYPGLGPRVSARISTLRRLRNPIAHENDAFLTHDEAIAYARTAFDVIGNFQRAWPEPLP
jgi:hypothetical protein